jgi:hypothetical protein
MLSFSKIVTLSAMALGTLTQAVPLLQRDAGVNARTTDVVSSTDKTHTLQFVLNDVTAQLNLKLNPVGMNAYSITYSMPLISKQFNSQLQRWIP